MSAYERQMIAKYHQADLLSEARQARLAKAARQAGGRVQTQRVMAVAVAGPLHAVLTSATSWLRHHGTAGVVSSPASQPSVSGHVMLRSAHPR